MSVSTRVNLLTPPGTGAIATVEVAGPLAWETARRLFRPLGKSPLPNAPELHRFWLGTFGEGLADEVILAVTAVEPEPRIEIHCHGGPRVVQWVITKCGVSSAECGVKDFTLLSKAPTLRTASILLDQAQGALARVLRRVLELIDRDVRVAWETLHNRVMVYERVGRHLVEPWKVVVAGPPNVGKSSLVNALAGYQRAVVSPTAGTTRDLVSAMLAFDGWPVELIDTAGLRAADGLEAEGIAKAQQALLDADLILWTLDREHPQIEYDDLPDDAIIRVSTAIAVINKCDLPGTDTDKEPHHPLRVSALTGEGIPALIAAIVDRLVANDPQPGAAVPYTPELADRLLDAQRALSQSRPADSKCILSECLQAVDKVGDLL